MFSFFDVYVCIVCTRLSRQGTRHENTEKVCLIQQKKSKVLLIAHCVAYSIWKVCLKKSESGMQLMAMEQ